jgi:phosphomannomutase
VENLRLVALATAHYVRSLQLRNPAVVIGYDTRFLSDFFAREVARVFASEALCAFGGELRANSGHLLPHQAEGGGAGGGDYGKPQSAAVQRIQGGGQTSAVRQHRNRLPSWSVSCSRCWRSRLGGGRSSRWRSISPSGMVRPFEPRESYIRHVRKKIQLELLRSSGLRVLHDPMYGAAMHLLRAMLPTVEEIHAEINPAFGELGQPEPMPEHLRATIEYVRAQRRYDLCLVTDGDGDRLAALDHEGNFVDSQRLFVLLLKYLYEDKRRRGAVVKTVSVTSMVDRYCERNNIPLYVTPVGFKHIARIMQQERVLLGGEESGGFATVIHLPERDGVFAGLLLLEMLVVRGKTLKQLCQELDEEFGPHRYRRVDVPVTQREKNAILRACSKRPARLGRYVVEHIDTTDGYKFYVPKGWLLVRPSGTEPLVRFYAEGDSMSMVNELLEEGRKLR